MGKVEDEFQKEAKRAEEEENARLDERAERSRNKGNFIEVKWTGVTKTPQMLILRFLGKKPDLHYGTTIPASTNTDARVVNLSRLISDNGKQLDMVLPLYDRDPNHIMWRIRDRINIIQWAKEKNDKGVEVSVKKFPMEVKHPDIFNIVNFNGLQPDNPQRKFGLLGKGWRGKEVVIANVIDRELLAWHKENKHTALLAKKINNKANSDGTVTQFIEKGVPAYGLSAPLMNLRKVYGDWENFDIGFTRTGKMDNPGEVFNASRTPERVESDTLSGLISALPLTEEEASWERYDIAKLFGITSYTKLWNRLHLTIERIDSLLGTFYADELKKLADSEVKPREEEHEVVVEEEVEEDIEEDTNIHTDAPVQQETAPITRRVKPVEDIVMVASDLPGYTSLTDKEKALILTVKMPEAGSKAYKIQYHESAGKAMGECPDCVTLSPSPFTHCPGCGATFTF